MKTIFLIFSFIFLLFSYIIFRVIVKKDYVKRKKLSMISYSLELLVFLIHANLIYLILVTQWPNLPPFPVNKTMKVVLITFFSIGFVILIISFFGLGSKASFGIDKNKLKINGLYKYSRNPQLVGYGIMLLVFTIAFFSWFVLFWFIQFLIVSFLMIKSEEEFLSQQYGEEYREYCNCVSRIINLKIR